MRTLRLIGIGPGHPDQVTAEAVEALRSCDVFFVSDKRDVKEHDDELVLARKEILARHGVGGRVVEVLDPPRDRASDAYDNAVRDWHEARAAAYEKTLLAETQDGDTIGLLVWGDPSLYDSTIRIAEQLAARMDLAYDVIPGVSSVQLLAARHRLVLNRVGAPVVITTGRRLLEDADTASDVVVMLDGKLSCSALVDAGQGDAWEIFWGVNLGTPTEALVAGPLAAVLPEIRTARTLARERAGWAMDVYLLRRTCTFPARTCTYPAPTGTSPDRTCANSQRTLVIGGARSGKSAFAEGLLADEPTTYVATSGERADDAEWLERVRAHAERRPDTWQTLETLDVAAVLRQDRGPVLIDCLTLWLTGVLDRHDAWGDWDVAAPQVEADIANLLAALADTTREVVLVTNEVGQGVVPDSEGGRRFRDLMGRVNQRAAAACDRVVWCVAGRTVEMGIDG